MKANKFLKDNFWHAQKVEVDTGLSKVLILAQAALESAWGAAAPGNMFFGVKDTDGVNGNEQLLTTTEYHTRNDVRYPEVISIKPVVKNGRKMFQYKVKDYFRKYPSPYECFSDHAKFFIANPRYGAAWQHRANPREFAEKIAKAGYATDPNYANSLIQVISSVEQRLKDLGF
jgi:flagellum-specific peptidoglycan hydrolase FlgJ